MRPISFNDEMVRAILDGRKTMTRRPVKMCQQFADWDASPESAYDVLSDGEGGFGFLVAGDQGYTEPIPCPYGKVGDLLWVEEAPRIGLRITRVRVERLQDISREEAIAEGIELRPHPSSGIDFEVGKRFIALWDSIYGGGEFAWARNPWVWVLSFEVVK